MSITLGVVMDPIESITPYKDTTLAMMLAAQARGWTVHSIDQKDMFLDQGRAFSRRRKVRVYDDNQHWFDAEEPVDAPMSEHDIVLMRKDPPFDMGFIYNCVAPIRVWTRIFFPIKVRMTCYGLRHIGRAIRCAERHILFGGMNIIAVKSVVLDEVTKQVLCVWIYKEFICVKAVPFMRCVRSVHAVAIEVSRL